MRLILCCYAGFLLGALGCRADRRISQRASCDNGKGRYCPNDSVCWQEQCFVPCDQKSSCSRGEVCMEVSWRGRCFDDAGGERAYCLRQDEVEAIARSVGGKWTNLQDGGRVNPDVGLEARWLSSVRSECQRLGQFGCDRICLEDSDCTTQQRCDCDAVQRIRDFATGTCASPLQ